MESNGTFRSLHQIVIITNQQDFMASASSQGQLSIELRVILNLRSAAVSSTSAETLLRTGCILYLQHFLFMR